MSAFFHGTFAVILNHAAPENCLAFVIHSFEFQPRIVGINRAPWKEMPDPLSSNHDVDTNRIAAADGRTYTIKRRGDGGGFDDFFVRNSCGSFRFFAHGKSGR